jgi:hypothetical protein
MLLCTNFCLKNKATQIVIEGFDRKKEAVTLFTRNESGTDIMANTPFRAKIEYARDALSPLTGIVFHEPAEEEDYADSQIHYVFSKKFNWIAINCQQKSGSYFVKTAASKSSEGKKRMLAVLPENTVIHYMRYSHKPFFNMVVAKDGAFSGITDGKAFEETMALLETSEKIIFRW